MGAQTEPLEQLLEASYALHESLDLDELLARILAVASKGVGADRGTVFLLDRKIDKKIDKKINEEPNRENGRLWSRVLSGDEMLEISLPVGQVSLPKSPSEMGSPRFHLGFRL